jgi:hypothetical protein
LLITILSIVNDPPNGAPNDPPYNLAAFKMDHLLCRSVYLILNWGSRSSRLRLPARDYLGT